MRVWQIIEEPETRMASKKVVLIVVGFLITVSSTALNGYVVAKSNKRTMDLTRNVSSLTQARDAAQAHIIESGAKGDSAASCLRCR